jgi:transposase
MPIRPFSREQTFLFPPLLDELVPVDHPVRYVALFVDGLTRTEWLKLGVVPEGEVRGAPGYAPAALLGAWLYGFMTGVRSSRKLEGACRDQLPYLWLTGWQRPDHNTLWRFYRIHRTGMRVLLKRTVRVAVATGLVDLAVQAVDGTRVAGSAARERTLDAAGLADLLGRVETAIADLEAQNTGGDDPPPARLPAELARAEALRARVLEALARVTDADGPTRANVTDPDATLQKRRGGGFQVGYNPQAMLAGVSAPQPDAPGHLLITAADVTADRDDHGQLVPLLEQAEAVTEAPIPEALADGGYHSAANLAACEERGQVIVMPDPQAPRPDQPYHKDRFVYDPVTDTFTCPQGQLLTFQGLDRRQAGGPPIRRYRGVLAVCAACPVRAACTTSTTRGRSVTRSPDDARLRRHRAFMATDAAKDAYRRRKTLPEPAFGILKEQQAARRFLLRGLDHVRDEWSLLATAFNLRTLAGLWQAAADPARPLAA